MTEMTLNGTTIQVHSTRVDYMESKGWVRTDAPADKKVAKAKKTTESEED
tara:strand:- start:108 stop:257 length:150 start_codon:yes stop_codon:yes gene_type:complete